MQWGQDEERPADPETEVVAFLNRRLGTGPALLWTDGEPPGGNPPGTAPTHGAARWADTLRRHLGRPVEPAGRLTAPEDGSLLLFQHHGGSRVRLTGTATHQDVRLRPGHWLLLPPGCGCDLQCRPGAEPLALRIPTA
ncbi:hypothetical protein [Kitasatospora cheerisanensis]|uniref:Uncharacterized protein n=1 Tax=Kitasatospora cheerisanensis KCTC 2395 TaxID=1348663 RepID=A0A066YZ69_9ACTN|nr:hypothetical protein [Kitasatospora cheerisanensis]KDN83185.1 hypothetical protein KCH_46670 [Kitasatospora cheerisanensis KCTC 2395]